MSLPGRYMLPRMPQGLEGLVELALDMRWSWSHHADALWRHLDPKLWQTQVGREVEDSGICLKYIMNSDLSRTRQLYLIDVIYGAGYIRLHEYIPLNAIPRHRARKTSALSASTP